VREPFLREKNRSRSTQAVFLRQKSVGLNTNRWRTRKAGHPRPRELGALSIAFKADAAVRTWEEDTILAYNALEMEPC
jgi:hypothetical protein